MDKIQEYPVIDFAQRPCQQPLSCSDTSSRILSHVVQKEQDMFSYPIEINVLKPRAMVTSVLMDVSDASSFPNKALLQYGSGTYHKVACYKSNKVTRFAFTTIERVMKKHEQPCERNHSLLAQHGLCANRETKKISKKVAYIYQPSLHGQSNLCVYGSDEKHILFVFSLCGETSHQNIQL